MRKHIDTLLGRKKTNNILPPPATAAEKEAWRYEVDLDTLTPQTTSITHLSSAFNSKFPYPGGPGHIDATPQQLAVMCNIMQAVGVSSFRPDFDEPPTSDDKKWLWALAFRIFIKLVEVGEYSGVSLDSQNLLLLKKSLNTRIASLTKQYVPLSTNNHPSHKPTC